MYDFLLYYVHVCKYYVQQIKQNPTGHKKRKFQSKIVVTCLFGGKSQGYLQAVADCHHMAFHMRYFFWSHERREMIMISS